MSDAGIENKGQMTQEDWDALDTECGYIASMFEAQLEQLQGGHISWMHLIGVAVLMLNDALRVDGVVPGNPNWMHTQILNLHEASHRYAQGGAAAVVEFNTALKEDALKPTACTTLH